MQIYNQDHAYCMYTIIGVVFYGNANCGAKGFPGIYTRVFAYVDWIESIVWPTTLTSRFGSSEKTEENEEDHFTFLLEEKEEDRHIFI